MIEIDFETVPSRCVRILVVEDEILIRLMICDALRDTGDALVISAATADEAWDYLIAEDGRVDVVFTDHRMPGKLTGAQLAAQVSTRFPHVRVVVTSGHFDGSEWEGPVLPKPYDLDQTVAMIVADAKLARGDV